MSCGRLIRFESFREHPMHGSLYKRLSKQEIALCREFIMRRSGDSKDAFASAVNCWFLDSKEKPKRLSDMWALVMQSNTGVKL